MASVAGVGEFDIQHDAIDDRPHAFRVRLRGDVDISTVAAFDAAIDALVADGARFVVLDLSAVSFVDSTGLRSIVRASRTLAERDGRLTCAGLSGAAAQVLEITGLLEGLRDPDGDPDGDV